MKIALLWLFVLGQSVALAQAQSDSVAVLFIGNSYTYFNNLPAIVESIAAHSGRRLKAEMVVAPGFSLKRHWQDTSQIALKKLQSRHWNFVVLQDQSQLGLTLAQSSPDKHWIAKPDTFYRYAQLWCTEIKKQQAVPCLATTWARAYDVAAQPLLTYAYITAARQTGALLIPVGEVWQQALKHYKHVRLYQSDDSHPAQAGSFLMALSVLRVLLPTLHLVVGYPITGLPVDANGHILNTSVHKMAPHPYSLYPSTNQVTLINLSKQEQHALLNVGLQANSLGHYLLKNTYSLPGGAVYH